MRTGFVVYLSRRSAIPSARALCVAGFLIFSLVASAQTYFLQSDGMHAPYPFDPYAGLEPMTEISPGVYLIQDNAQDFATMQSFGRSASMMSMDVPNPGEGGSGTNGGFYSDSFNFSFDTNSLWLEITNVSAGTVFANLHNATDYVYEIWSKTDLAATNWDIENEVFPANTNCQPFTVWQSERTNLFLWARDWTGITSSGNTVPEWWFWKFYHTLDGLSDSTADSTGENTLYEDYLYGYDPNVIEFSLSVANDRVNTDLITVQLSVLNGTPAYASALVNDTNMASASWQPFTTNVFASLGATDGVYDISVGARGWPSDATESWNDISVVLDKEPPTLFMTNPATVSTPFIQMEGTVDEELSSLTFDVSNAAGIFTNQIGYTSDLFYDTNLMRFTTNSVDLYDVALTNGLNAITIYATDLAGNVSITNYYVILDYSSDTNPPVLSLIWPQDGTLVGGSELTLQARIDDITAKVFAIAGGQTNVAAVQRNGKVQTIVPLNSQTNLVSITAIDAAGNTFTTNITVIQSAVTLMIDPISDDQLNQTSIYVSGTISDPDAQISVNGVDGINYGDGTWDADGVPVSSTGSADVNAEALDESNNVLSSQLLNQIQPAIVVLKSIFQSDYFWNVLRDGSIYYGIGTEGGTLNWNYKNGGSWTFWQNPPGWVDTYDIDAAGSDLTTPQFTGDGIRPAWENGRLNIAGAEYGTQRTTQIHTMVVPANGQTDVGSTALYLVRAILYEMSAYDRVDFGLISGADYLNLPLPPEWVQINGHAAVNSGITNSDGSIWGETLVAAPSGTTPDIKTSASRYYDYDDFRVTNQVRQVKLQIEDVNGNDLTTQTNTVIVGQQINLTCALNVTNSALNNSMLQNFQWTVPGFAISNYVVAPDASSAFVATNFPTTKSNAVFYWVDGGLKQVQASATVNGTKVTGQAWLNVLRPTVTVTAYTTSVNVDTFLGDLGFHDTNTFAAGITFSNTITIPLGFSGSREWIQIVNPYRSYRDTNEVWWVLSDNGSGPYLDTVYPYTNSATTESVTVDSPEEPLLRGRNEVTANDSFKMWLMFKPTGGNWIPLRIVNWNWSGIASLSGSNWSLTSRSWLTNPPSVDAKTTFPQWKNNVKNLLFYSQP
ncbi:MAG TPA: hypothetical protein VFV23_04765 [Verrucomicrobiae bacterium]|nr:hypothetical protein [Verrucomicrobiae bacterium]